jgi:UDP-N-acetylmuramyl tripeptide synthase
LAHQYTDFFVITNEDPYNESPEIIDEVAAGVPIAAEGHQFVRELHRDAAIKLAFDRALPGDTVLVWARATNRAW